MTAPAPASSRMATSQSRWSFGRWIGRGAWAIVDKALFAVANFALNVLLARWLLAAEYGAFTVAYTVFLLLGTLHTALLAEPMLVFGSGKYRERLLEYMRTLLRAHWAFGLIASVGLAAAGFVLVGNGDGHLGRALAAFAVAAPFILYQWLLRLACYVERVPRVAAEAGVAYMLLMVAGMVGLFHLGLLGMTTAPLVMGVASIASGRWVVRRLGLAAGPAPAGDVRRSVRYDHWQYGRWALGVAGLSWLAGNVVYFALPIFAGLEAVGQLRAGVNLIMPVLQGLAALAVVVLPELVRAFERGLLIARTRLFVLIFVAAAASYGTLLYLFAEPISALLYGERYPDLARLVPVLAGLPVAVAIVSVLGAALRAIEKPRSVFVAYAASASMALTVGVWLVHAHGTVGAVASMLIASLVTGGVLFSMLRRHGRRSVAGPESESAVQS